MKNKFNIGDEVQVITCGHEDTVFVISEIKKGKEGNIYYSDGSVTFIESVLKKVETLNAYCYQDKEDKGYYWFEKLNPDTDYFNRAEKYDFKIKKDEQ